MFRGTEIAKHYSNGIVPDNTPLHPTPVYEFLAALMIFYILWKLRKKDWSDGKLFMCYLVFAGIERFLVEIIRLNPKLLFGLTEAQLISVAMIIIGVVGFIYLTKRNKPKFIPEPIKQEKKKKTLKEAST